MIGPTLSPLASLCLTCAPSHLGKVPDCQHLQRTAFSPALSSRVLTTLGDSRSIFSLIFLACVCMCVYVCIYGWVGCPGGDVTASFQQTAHTHTDLHRCNTQSPHIHTCMATLLRPWMGMTNAETVEARQAVARRVWKSFMVLVLVGRSPVRVRVCVWVLVNSYGMRIYYWLCVCRVSNTTNVSFCSADRQSQRTNGCLGHHKFRHHVRVK